MPKDRPRKDKWRLLHQYYSYTGFYKFMKEGVKKALLPIIGVVLVLMYVNYNVININDLLVKLTEDFSYLTILTVFFLSEAILGLIPPDIFIAWTKTTEYPILLLSLLAVLSYLGGVVSYLLGKATLKIPSFKNYLENKMSKHIINMRKWGGFLIAVGALLPLPFAMAAMAAGIINFNFRTFLMFALLRLLRFVIYGFAIYQMI